MEPIFTPIQQLSIVYRKLKTLNNSGSILGGGNPEKIWSKFWMIQNSRSFWC